MVTSRSGVEGSGPDWGAKLSQEVGGQVKGCPTQPPTLHPHRGPPDQSSLSNSKRPFWRCRLALV